MPLAETIPPYPPQFEMLARETINGQHIATVKQTTRGITDARNANTSFPNQQNEPTRADVIGKALTEGAIYPESSRNFTGVTNVQDGSNWLSGIEQCNFTYPEETRTVILDQSYETATDADIIAAGQQNGDLVSG